MSIRITAFLTAVLMLLSAGACLAEGEKTYLTVYEGPKTMSTSSTARVKVNGVELFVYDVMVNHEHIWNANTVPVTTPMTYFEIGRAYV